MFKHVVDWGAVAPSDLDSLTWRLIGALEPATNRGCYYLNPGYSVTSPSPLPEFYREAIWARETWLRRLRQTMGNFGLRQLSRSLSVTKRQLALSGVLFVNGVNLHQPIWQAEADRLLNKDASRVTVSRRRVDLSALKSSGDVAPFVRISREQLQALLDNDPSGSHFVCPLLTVSSPTPTIAFYEKARRASDEWHGRLRKKLGKDGRQSLFGSIDDPLKYLLSGILVIDGQLYLPGCWPNQHVTDKRLKQAPFRSRTVPMEDLNIDHRNLEQPGCDRPCLGFVQGQENAE